MKRLFFALTFLLLAAASLRAHDLFIKLETFFVAPHSRVRVPLLNGTFRRSENSVTRDRIADLSLVTPAGVSHPTDSTWLDIGDTTFFDITTGDAGTHVIGVSTRPRELELEGKEFNAYLREEGILDILAARTKSGQLKSKARERYSKHVKAVLQAGNRRSDGFGTPLGYPAEIVPLTNPYSLRPGAVLRIRCTVDGSPVADQVVIAGVQLGRERPQQWRIRTDSSGVAAVRLRGRGKWFVKFIRMTPATETGLDYESKWATLTFGVR